MMLLLLVMFAFAATCCRRHSRNATARLLLCAQCRSQGVLYAVIHVAQIEKLVIVLGRLRLRMIHGTRTTVRWPPSLFRLWFGLRRRFLPRYLQNWFPNTRRDDVSGSTGEPFFCSAFATLVVTRTHSRAHTHSHTHTGGTYTRTYTHTLTPSAVGAGRRARKNCSFFFFLKI